MIVCLCRVVTDRTVRESIRGGARTVEEVGASCRAGTSCGACRPMIASMIHEETCAGECERCPERQRLGITSPYLASSGKAA